MVLQLLNLLSMVNLCQSCSAIIWLDILCPGLESLRVYHYVVHDASAYRWQYATERSAAPGHDEHVVFAVVLLDESEVPFRSIERASALGGCLLHLCRDLVDLPQGILLGVQDLHGVLGLESLVGLEGVLMVVTFLDLEDLLAVRGCLVE